MAENFPTSRQAYIMAKILYSKILTLEKKLKAENAKLAFFVRCLNNEDLEAYLTTTSEVEK